MAFPALGLALLALVALTRRADLAAATEVLGQVSLLPFALAVGFSVLGMANRAAQIRSAHRLAGMATSLTSMARVSAAGYALNKVVRTGGLGGMALFVRHGRRHGRPGGAVVAACLISSASGHLAMVAIAVGALVSLAASGSLTGAWLTAVVAVVALLVVGLPAAGAAGLRSRGLVERWYDAPFETIGRLAQRVGMTGPARPDPIHIDRFYDAMAGLRRNPVASLPLLTHALAAKLLGAAILGATLQAVGADVGPGPALAIYTLALLAAATSILPGGLGAVEATMTMLLTGHGVPTSTALAATVAFRVLDLWLPVLIGLIAVPGLKRAPTPVDRPTDRTGAGATIGGVSDWARPGVQVSAPTPAMSASSMS